MIYRTNPTRRGVYDEEKALRYKEYLGHPLTKEEMRLVPYVHYCAVNQKPIERSKVNAAERALLKEWTNDGKCDCYPFISPVTPTRRFWGFMCDVLFDFYVVEAIPLEDADGEEIHFIDLFGALKVIEDE